MMLNFSQAEAIFLYMKNAARSVRAGCVILPSSESVWDLRSLSRTEWNRAGDPPSLRVGFVHRTEPRCQCGRDCVAPQQYESQFRCPPELIHRAFWSIPT